MRPAVLLFGPTASGKTALSLPLANMLGAEIVNADSRQVYCHMPILTAAPKANEYAQAPHHLFEFLQPDASFSVTNWLQMAVATANDIWQRGKIPLFVGGTGFYMDVLQHGLSPLPATDADVLAALKAEQAQQGTEALYQQLKEVDPLLAAQLKPGDSQRVMRGLAVWRQTGQQLSELQLHEREGGLQAKFVRLALCPPRDVLYQRIHDRFDAMLDDGMMEEVKLILGSKWPLTLPAFKSIGIPEYARWQAGELTLPQAHTLVQQHMRNYAKRQETWLKHQYNSQMTLTHADQLEKAAAFLGNELGENIA